MASIVQRTRAMTAVSAMLDVAFHAGRSNTVNAADIAERLGLARRGMEPLLQCLSRAALLESVRGPKGGYRLSRPPRDIRLSDIVACAQVEEEEPAQGASGSLQEAVIDPFWDELDAMIREKLRDLTLEDLLRRAASAGLRRTPAEPISFSI
jgi:Rrf2 family protein